jgi:hypothetical protein
LTESPQLIFDGSMYVAMNLVLTLATAFWLATLFRTRRYLFVKPSMMLLGWTHLFFQWPAAIYARYYELALPDAYSLVLLLHGFVLLGLLVSSRSFDLDARIVFQRVTEEDSPGSVSISLLLLSYCAIVVSTYLSVVPFTSTGLYVMASNPVLAAVARENSLKLITSAPVKYLYTTMVTGVAPFLVVLLAMSGRRFSRRGNAFGVFFVVTAILAVLLASSLAGARATVLNLLLAIAIAFFFLRGLPFRPARFLLTAAVLLIPPVIITIVREGKSVEFDLFVTYLSNDIFRRAFVMPLHVGIFYVHYAETVRTFGISAVPRLAGMFGIPAVDATNLIGNVYAYSGIDTVSAGAGFLFTYYSYFGMWALPISLAGLWLLDLAVPLYRLLDPRLLVPTLSAASFSTINFISADYTTVWLTHGFGTILLLGAVFSKYLGYSEPDEGFSARPAFAAEP